MRSSKARLGSSHYIVVLAVFLGALGLPSPARASGFEGHLIWSAQGGQPGAAFGSAVASAGDVNGDGFPDLVVGAPRYDGGAGVDCGAAFVFYGTASGPARVAGWSVEGEQEKALFGWAVASAGDVNGDGFGDVVIGSPGYEIPDPFPHFRFAGRIYVYLGSAQGLASTPVLAADGQPYDLGFREGLGGTVTSGDFNGDGLSDVVGGQYATYFGAAWVYYGSSAGPSLGGRSWYGAPPGTFWGNSIAAADVNGDGYDDLFLTGLDLEFGPPRAVAYLGSTHGLPAAEGDPPAIPPSYGFDGWSNVASVGDVEGDGYDDVLVTRGDFNSSMDLLAHALFRGSPGGLLPAGDPAPVLGIPGRLVPLGDVDGDGFPDAVTQDGATFYFYLGSASGFRAISDGMGTLAAIVAAAGDVNRDGFADIGVGDPAHERVDVFRGGTDWSFSATADLAIRMEASESSNFFVTVTSQGPETVRFRLRDVLTPAFPDASWICYRQDGGVMSSCLTEGGQGDVDSLVTILPGSVIYYAIQFLPVFLPVTNTAFLDLPDWVDDPDLSNNQATATVGPAEEALFADGFESGDLSAWSPSGEEGLAVLPAAALEGSYGLAVTAPPSGAAFLRHEAPGPERAYHARFRLDPRSFGARGRRRAVHEAVLFSGKDAAGPAAFEILLRRSEGELFLGARAALDGGPTKTELVPIADAPHVVDVGWRRAGGPGVNDGLLLLRIDGASGASLTGLDNDETTGVGSVEWGLTLLGDDAWSGTRGPIFLDSFASWRVP